MPGEPLAGRVRAVALVALLALAPSVAAQAETVQSTTGVLLSDLGGPVFPGVPVNMTVTVTYRHGVGGAGATGTEVEVVAAEVPPWANFTLDQTTFEFVVDPFDPQPKEQRATTTAVLWLDAKAPAFQRGNLTVVATATPNGNVRGSQGQSQIFVIPAFDPTLEIDAPNDLRIRGGLAHPVPFTVTNLGNAQAIVRFDFPSKPETTLVTPPEPLALAPGETGTREIVLRPSWVEAGSGILTIAATPTIEDRENLEVEPTTHDVLVTSVAAVPAPLGLLALAAAALAWRRRA